MLRAFALCVLMTGLMGTFAPLAFGSHSEAPVSDVDGDFGLSLNSVAGGNYTHGTADHPWYTFDATAGDRVSLVLTTQFTQGGSGNGSYLWLYEVLDGSVNIGDASPIALNLVAESFNEDFAPGPYLDQSILDFVIPQTNQYIVQVDSWLGASGTYSLAYRRVPVPEPSTWALGLIGLAALGVVARRRKK